MRQLPFAMLNCELITTGPVPALRFMVVGALEDEARLAAAESNQMFAIVNSMEPSAPLLKFLPCYMNDAIHFDARLPKQKTHMAALHRRPHASLSSQAERRPARRSSCMDQCSSIQA